MIITITMNPAIDKTVEVDQLIPRGLNRIKKVIYDAGGKGINVSKTIQALGGTSTAIGFLAGGNGKMMDSMLKETGIATDFLFIGGETRTNTKVVEDSGALTELNEPGPFVSDKDLKRFMEKVRRYAAPDSLFVLSGSIPKGVPKDIYASIISLVHEKGGSCLLDADGELFQKGLSASPDFIKPNRFELALYAGIPESEMTNGKIAETIHTLRRNHGFQLNAAVSMGGEGALFFLGDRMFTCPALNIKLHSTVGAGDAMVASMAYALENHLSDEEIVRLAMAVSAGACTTLGTKPPSPEVVSELKKQVQIIYRLQ